MLTLAQEGTIIEEERIEQWNLKDKFLIMRKEIQNIVVVGMNKTLPLLLYL